MKRPSFTSANLSALRQSLIKQNKLQSIEQDEAIPVIPSGSQPLDWVTDCGGLPRGRVVQFKGPESSGKCVSLKTWVPVFGQGLVPLGDLCSQVDWRVDGAGQVVADQHQGLTLQVPGSNGEPVNSTDIYYAGNLSTYKIGTEDGHELTGAKDHRVLTLNSSGMLSYVMLRDIRVGSVIVKTIGQRVTGPVEKVWGWDLPVDHRPLTFREAATAALLGALCGVEFRDNCYYLMVGHPHQIRLVRQWARDVTGDDETHIFDEMVTDFARFSGMARIRPGTWSELARRAREVVPAAIRQSSLTAQAHWCAGLTLVRGAWTQNDLEFEIQNPDVARTLHLVMENIGVRSMIYPCLNTFASEMTKVALRDRIAQQTAHEFLWGGYDLPPDWKGCSVCEDEETHRFAAESLQRAREILIKEGQRSQAERIDTEDLDKDNLGSVAESMFSLARKSKSVNRVYESILLLSSPCTYLDTVIAAKALPVQEPLADLRVPIGCHYSTNGIISHNSTLALHYARNELMTNPKAVVVYQDYEHSMTPRYARKILKANFDRFFLIPSDAFEDVDKLLSLFFRTHNVSPALWIVDSVPAMVPQVMFGKFANDDDDEDEEGDGKKKKGVRLGLQAALFSEALARWVKLAGGYGTTFLMLNQIRASIKINQFQKTDGSDRGAGVTGESTPGGYALRFYNSLTLELRLILTLKAKMFNPLLAATEEIPVANSVRIKVTKNKCGAPQRSCQVYIQYGEGVDDIRTLFDLGFNRGMIKTPSKGVYALSLDDGTMLAVHGRENFIDTLKGKIRNDLGPPAIDQLKRLLKWDRIDEVHSQVIGLSEEDHESGETTNLESEEESGEADSGILEYVRSLTTFGEKADALDILRWDKKTAIWVNPVTGEEFRGRSLPKFVDRLDDDSQDLFIKQVQEKIKEMESRVSPDGAVPGSSPATAIDITPPPPGTPLALESDVPPLDDLLSPKTVEYQGESYAPEGGGDVSGISTVEEDGSDGSAETGEYYEEAYADGETVRYEEVPGEGGTGEGSPEGDSPLG